MSQPRRPPLILVLAAIAVALGIWPVILFLAERIVWTW